MENRKLEVHTFHLVDKKNKDLIINPENVSGIDFFDTLKNNFIDFVDSLPPSDIWERTSKIEVKAGSKIFKFNDDVRYVSGKIKIGNDQNKEQDVVSTNKKKDVLYTIGKGESVERPYYFMVILPAKKNRGFIVIEREGRHTMKRIFSRILEKFVSEKLSTAKIEIKGFVEDKIIRDYLENGDYERITLNRSIIPNDLSERYLGKFHQTGKYQVQLNIIPKEKTLFPLFAKQKILRNLDSYDGFFEDEHLKELGFDENSDIKVVTTLHGNTRTIDLRDTFKMRPYYLIAVNIDSKGFSDFDNINRESATLLKSFNLDIL